MSDLNKAMLIGRLGRDPEGHAMPSGDKVASFSIATSEKWKDRETQEQKERTEWHKITVFGGLADVCLKYLKKGSQVFIEGSLRTREWTDKQGNKRYITEIVCQSMQMLGSKGDGSSGNRPPPPNERPASPQRNPSPSQAAGSSGGDRDDDIPF